jgi:putative SOS response-associated peptidase YedK
VCGKFTAMFSYRQVWEQENAFYEHTKAKDDREVSYRVMSDVPLILFDHVNNKRRVEMMRWGFPHPKDWKRPQPIHARSETLEITKAFAEAFHDGQRGIVLVKTFNEAPDIQGPTQQHTITPDAEAIGIAFIWRQFEAPRASSRDLNVIIVVSSQFPGDRNSCHRILLRL